MKNNGERRLWIIAIGLSLISIVLIASQFAFSSDIRHDKQTVEDLRAVEEQLRVSDSPAQSIKELELPEDIQQRIKERNYSVSYLRQEGNVYVYEICAEFRTNTGEDVKFGYYQDYTDHAAGEECFEREIHTYELISPGSR